MQTGLTRGKELEIAEFLLIVGTILGRPHIRTANANSLAAALFLLIVCGLKPHTIDQTTTERPVDSPEQMAHRQGRSWTSTRTVLRGQASILANSSRDGATTHHNLSLRHDLLKHTATVRMPTSPPTPAANPQLHPSGRLTVGDNPSLHPTAHLAGRGTHLSLVLTSSR